MNAAWILSFLIAALSGMGVGSGGLLVIYLSLMTDMPQFAAQGLNLLFFLFSAASSLGIHMQKRRLIAPAILTMALAGMLGSPLGTLAAKALPSEVLRQIFGGVLMVSGLLSLRKALKTRKNKKILP